MITRDELKKHLSYNKLNGQFTWLQGQRIWRIAGCINKADGYRQIALNNKTYKAHRLVFLFMTGNIPNYVDHINGNRDDNRWENLRACTSQENNRNKRLTTCLTGIKGVTKRKDTGAYQVQIRANNKKLYLGCYYDLELAELIAQEAREHYHGEFARHV